MITSAIVAMSSNRVIGKDGGLPWHLPRDMKFFKKTTMGHHVIMGRESFASMGYVPLKGRVNIVLTRNPYWITSSAVVMHSIEEALAYSLDQGEQEAFIIGGGKIFDQSLHLIEKIYLTEVISHVVGDIYFPELDMDEWLTASSEFFETDDKNEFPMRFLELQRK
ncbi:MAG: dihydrofolate reductase [Bacteroidota bacterium]|nr:dihydrofolate reductase [Bacteroidota bacterium]